MPEELETQETQQNPNNVPEPDLPAKAWQAGDLVPDSIGDLKTQLEDERKAKAAVEATLAERDTRIAELAASLNEAKQSVESLRAEGVAISQSRDYATSKYLKAVKAANPDLPDDAITGATIEEIDASLANARSIAEAVRTNLEAQARETRVPAGAPTRTVNLEGMTPDELIRTGLTQIQT